MVLFIEKKFLFFIFLIEKKIFQLFFSVLFFPISPGNAPFWRQRFGAEVLALGRYGTDVSESGRFGT